MQYAQQTGLNEHVNAQDSSEKQLQQSVRLFSFHLHIWQLISGSKRSRSCLHQKYIWFSFPISQQQGMGFEGTDLKDLWLYRSLIRHCTVVSSLGPEA